MRRVVVLGAGVTGLAAADRLLELGGCDVSVVEVETAVGGLAATVAHEGIATDLGPHRLYTELPEVRKFLPDLLGEQLIRVRRSSRMLLDGRWISYPLKAGEVLRTLGMGRVLRFSAGLAAARLGAPFARRSKATFENCMKRAYGAPVYRKIFEPYARKVWRTEPTELSAEIARVRLPHRGVAAAFNRALRGEFFRGSGPLREFLYVRGGIGQVCERLAERVRQRGGRILLQSRVIELKFSATGVSAVVTRQLETSVSLDADAVISTIPLPLLGAMLPGGDAASRAALASLEYLALTLVVLVVAKQRIGPDHWLYFPQEPPLPTRACEPKNFDPSMAPADKSALCCEITSRCDEPLRETSDSDIASRVEEDMVATGLIGHGDIVSRFVIRKNWAYPIYAVGFEKTLEAVWPFFARIPNLLSVGRQGLFNHNNVDHCLVMGRRAAEAVAASREPARGWYEGLGQFAHFRILD